MQKVRPREGPGGGSSSHDLALSCPSVSFRLWIFGHITSSGESGEGLSKEIACVDLCLPLGTGDVTQLPASCAFGEESSRVVELKS